MLVDIDSERISAVVRVSHLLGYNRTETVNVIVCKYEWVLADDACNILFVSRLILRLFVLWFDRVF